MVIVKQQIQQLPWSHTTTGLAEAETEWTGMVIFTSRYCKRDVVLFTEVYRKDGMRRGVVTKPVGAIVWYGAIDTHHQVAVQQNLGGVEGGAVSINCLR